MRRINRIALGADTNPLGTGLDERIDDLRITRQLPMCPFSHQ